MSLDNCKNKINKQNNINEKQIKKNRCWSCNKKVGILGFDCECGYIFCGKHRYTYEHNCSIDKKNKHKINLQNNMPIIKSDKIKDRI